MSNNPNYIEINKKSWNKKTAVHLKSEFYDQENFLNGQTSLNDIELNLLGNIEGKSRYFGDVYHSNRKSIGKKKVVDPARYLSEDQTNL